MQVLDFCARRAAPMILQTEAAECGLAALAMVATHHGYDTDLASLRRQYPLSLKGSTLNDLMRIAARLKLSARPVKVEFAALDRLALPAILHWDFNHFVVLTSCNDRRLVIHDPARGKRVMTRDEASRHFTGVALELSPALDFEPKRQRQKLRLGELLGRLPGIAGTIAQVALLALSLEVLAVLSPTFMQLVVDQAIVTGDRSLIAMLSVGFLMLALIQVGITALRSWVVMVVSTKLNLQLFSGLFRRLLHLPMSFFEKRQLGDIVSRFDSLETIQRTLSTSAVEAVIDGLMAIVTLLMMMIYGFKLTLLVVAAAFLYAVLRWSLYRRLRQVQEEQIVRSAKQQTNFLETVRGMQSIKLFNRQVSRHFVYQNLLVDNLNASVRIQKMHILFRVSDGALFAIENIAVIWLGALMVVDSSMSLGMLFAFMAYKMQFTARIVGLLEKGIELSMLGLHSDRVADVALTTPEPEDREERTGADADDLPPVTLEVRNLSFRYSDSEPWVLRHVSFRIEAGESVAIVGPSGCGKTTLLKVLLGLLTPSEGEVIVAGEPISRLGLQRYRELVGTVMQDDQLFAGSIADNVGFFDPRLDRDRVTSCAKIAALHDDIERMPMRYNTLIGDMGTVLSGGQKQRLLLARALYKNPRMLFLDEATSHLDGARERAVNDAIRQQQLTRVIVAHRQETIDSADRVITLVEGRAPTAGALAVA